MTSFFERLYFATPIWGQQLGVALYGWWWYHRRFGDSFKYWVQHLRQQEDWTLGQFQDYQAQTLQKILRSAQRANYYRPILEYFEEASTSSPLDLLTTLPLLTKETLRSRAHDLLTANPIPKHTLKFKSSGTTGTPTEIYYTPDFHSFQMALHEVRGYRWAGTTYRAKRVMFGVRKVCRFAQTRPPFWRYSPAENLAYSSIYHLSPQFIPYYLKFLRDYQPTIVMGYPSALYTLARHALETHDLPAPTQAVVTTSETVTPQIRATIESAFQCRLYDRYGAVEGCMYAAQCEHGRYHLSPEAGIVELLDRSGQPVAPGQLGEVVCTGLQNTLQPLIRYQTGDVARWAIDQYCACGRQMPILENVEGRFEDICYTPDGRELLRFDTVFKGVENVRESQVIQVALDHFLILVVPATGFNQDEIEKIQANMRLHVGSVTTEVRPVTNISRSPGGKFRAVVCALSDEQKEQWSKNV